MAKPGTPLGDLLRAHRRARGWSRPRTAELTGLNAATIESWELGRIAKPALHDVLKLARALDIPLSEIERVVLAEPTRSSPPAPAPPRAAGETDGTRLLERTIAALRWRDEDVARALGVSSLRVHALRQGGETLTTAEIVALTALLLTEHGAAPSGIPMPDAAPGPGDEPRQSGPPRGVSQASRSSPWRSSSA